MKYAVGVDFGTLSARALVVEIGTGRELADASMEYPHAVMDEALPCGRRLKQDCALQHPQDYLECMSYTVRTAIRKAGVSAEDVVGVGIDFTTCTILGVDKSGMPLCFQAEYAENPYAYVSLWKHHGAQSEADRMTEVAQERGEEFLQRFGGKVSSERMLPKIWEILKEAPEVYEAADKFMEAGDWLVMQLTGKEARNACMAGYKAFWHKSKGYPSKEYLKAVDEALENVVEDKLSNDIYPIGAKAGEITESAAELTGLNVGTAVAVAVGDAHVALPAVGFVYAGDLLMILGTSGCHLLLGDEEYIVPGMCGEVEDGIVPGLFGYEAGQTCFGDHYQWFVDNCVPESYAEEARKQGIGLHQYLTEKAALQKPGESGLLALDWWNGNRSVLVDANLTGLMLGMTLTTKPEEMYRALIEATAYGTRKIIDTFDASGVPIRRICAGGGIAKKNPFLMQILADVCNREISIAHSAQAAALGSAMYGAVAAGRARGGYDTIAEAAAEIGRLDDTVYRPIPEHAAVYQKLYEEYERLHDYFGRGGNDVMKRLKAIKDIQRS